MHKPIIVVLGTVTTPKASSVVFLFVLKIITAGCLCVSPPRGWHVMELELQ